MQPEGDNASRPGSVTPFPNAPGLPVTSGDKLLRLPAVKARVGLGKTEIYRRMRANPPTFPSAIKLAPRVTVWRESEIDAFVSEAIRSARAEAA